MNDDKALERQRYDESASLSLANAIAAKVSENFDPTERLAEYYRAPYIAYVEALRTRLYSGCSVLEIGAGKGYYTGILVASGARVCATDISPLSLRVLLERLGNLPLETQVADMEELPFEDQTFDFVASAGSLSYGDNARVLKEIHRVLKSGGIFICVDSLNHNPIYRLNRWLNYMRGDRTRSTLLRMPTLELIRRYELHFGACESEFFGSLSWLMPLISRVFGNRLATKFSDRWDRMFNVRKSAFKFVMVATKASDGGRRCLAYSGGLGRPP